MKTQLVRAIMLIFGFLLVLGSQQVMSDEGDTTWVRTYDHDFYNWATAHVDTFAFPDTTVSYKKIMMFYRIGCPGPPADCDPWDRLGYLQVLHDTGEVDTLGQPVLEPFEVARIITPYDITGGSRPDSCTWEIDVTPYRSLLHDTVVLSNYIETWMGNEYGWIVTIDFAFIEGSKCVEPYKVVNLWQDYNVLYGDPADPPEDYLQPLIVDIDDQAAAVGLRVITTGHGQGNTNNCAEFCSKEHTVYVNGDEYSHFLWRDDCSSNPCHPQGGTWQFSRAGWCPGASVISWDLNVTGSVVPGEQAEIDYDLEEYENFCRPTNPDCVNGQTCPDCDYNYTGHTPPHYSIQAQLVFYRETGPVGIDDENEAKPDVSVPKEAFLYQNYPNPFNPSTTIPFAVPGENGEQIGVILSVYDVRGRLVKTLVDKQLSPGKHEVIWKGTDDRGVAVPSGVYMTSLRSGTEIVTRKLVLLK